MEISFENVRIVVDENEMKNRLKFDNAMLKQGRYNKEVIKSLVKRQLNDLLKVEIVDNG